METEDSGLFAGRLEAAEREAAQQRSAAEEARGAAAKLEADLEGLSGAYNSLETHSFALEARVRQLESSGVQKGAAEDSAAEAAAADEEEEDDGLNDLLICLGQASAFFTLALTTPSSPAVFLAFSSCCVNITARGVYTAIFLATRGSVCGTTFQLTVTIGVFSTIARMSTRCMLRVHHEASFTVAYDGLQMDREVGRVCFCRRSRRWSG